MPAHSRSKNGIASLAYVAGIHIFQRTTRKQLVDGRNKSGHDESHSAASRGGGRIDSSPSTAVAEIVVRTM
jgi:hypothetical protein